MGPGYNTCSLSDYKFHNNAILFHHLIRSPSAILIIIKKKFFLVPQNQLLLLPNHSPMWVYLQFVKTIIVLSAGLSKANIRSYLYSSSLNRAQTSENVMVSTCTLVLQWPILQNTVGPEPWSSQEQLCS